MPAHATRRTTRHPGRGGGFTFIELIAVMVVIAVLAATAAPALSGASTSRAAMASKMLLRDLTYARQRAVATGTTTWVVFDASAETWSVLAEDPDNPGRANAAVITDPATNGDYTQTLGTGSFPGVTVVTVDFDSDDEIGFDWLGRPLNESETDLAATGSVDLSQGWGVEVTVETGRIVAITGS